MKLDSFVLKYDSVVTFFGNSYSFFPLLLLHKQSTKQALGSNSLLPKKSTFQISRSLRNMEKWILLVDDQNKIDLDKCKRPRATWFAFSSSSRTHTSSKHDATLLCALIHLPHLPHNTQQAGSKSLAMAWGDARCTITPWGHWWGPQTFLVMKEDDTLNNALKGEQGLTCIERSIIYFQLGQRRQFVLRGSEEDQKDPSACCWNRQVQWWKADVITRQSEVGYLRPPERETQKMGQGVWGQNWGHHLKEAGWHPYGKRVQLPLGSSISVPSGQRTPVGSYAWL